MHKSFTSVVIPCSKPKVTSSPRPFFLFRKCSARNCASWRLLKKEHRRPRSTRTRVSATLRLCVSDPDGTRLRPGHEPDQPPGSDSASQEGEGARVRAALGKGDAQTPGVHHAGKQSVCIFFFFFFSPSNKCAAARKKKKKIPPFYKGVLQVVVAVRLSLLVPRSLEGLKVGMKRPC